MSSEHLASAQNELKGNLGGAWNILDGAQGQYQDLGVARRFGGSSAAYSLRDIGAINGKVVRVRREPHDTSAGIDDEINFSANQISSGALEDWVNGKVEDTLPADVATAAAAYSLRKVKASYGIPVTEVNGTDGFPATLLQSAQSITGTSFTARHFSNNSPDSSEATAANGVYRVSATKTSAAAFAKAIRIQGLEDGKQYTVKGEFRMVEDTTSGGDSVAQVDISDNSAGTDEDIITTTSTTFVPFLIDAGYNSGSNDNFVDFTVSAVGSETGTITAEFRNVQIIENNNSAVRIRRSSDDVEVIVGFDSDDKVSASSAITNVSEEGGEIGSTTATDLNGFLNETLTVGTAENGTGGFSNYTLTNVSDTGFSADNSAGGTGSAGFPYKHSTGDVMVVRFTVSNFNSTSSLSPVLRGTSGLGSVVGTAGGGGEILANGIYTETLTAIADGTHLMFADGNTGSYTISDFQIVSHTHQAFVHTWYDQAGSNNAVQETAANQPKIAENGALLADGLDFDGVNDYMDFTSDLTAPFWSFITHKATKNNSAVFGVTATYDIWLGRRSTGTYLQVVTSVLSGGIYPDSIVLRTDKVDADGAEIFSNANSLASGDNATTNLGSWGRLGAQGQLSSTKFLEGNIKEAIFYTSDQAANRFKIESNINNYYGLYNDANETNDTQFQFQDERSGGVSVANGVNGFTLDTQTAAAFAGIQLNEKVASGDSIFVSCNITTLTAGSATASPRCQLRKSTLGGTDGSNFVNLTLGFNSFILTSTDSDVDFVSFSEGDDNTIFTLTDFKVSRIARNGFVETWYDQSGNGEDMTQGTAGKQPSIILNGGQVKDYKGNNSIDFVSGSTRVLDKSGTTTAKTCIVVLDEDSSGSAERAILGFSDSTSFMRLDTGNDLEVKAGGVSANYRAVPTDVTSLYFWYTNGTDEDKLFANNVEEGDTLSSTPPNLPFTRIGARNSDSDPYNSRITEVIAFAEDLSADRTVLQDDINNNYNIF